MINRPTPILISQVPLFNGLSSRELKVLGYALREKSFKKGEILFWDGKRCEQVVIIRSGSVKVFKTTASGREQIYEILTPGDTCACNLGCANNCFSNSQALTDCSIWLLDNKTYRQLLSSSMPMQNSLNQIFSARLRKFSTLIENISLDDPRQRLAKFILDFSTSQESLFPTHEEISQRVGLVRETVSRHLQQLKKEKLVAIKARKLSIIDKIALERISGRF